MFITRAQKEFLFWGNLLSGSYDNYYVFLTVYNPNFTYDTLDTLLVVCFLGKHRKHPGGRGNAGGQHHHGINFDK